MACLQKGLRSTESFLLLFPACLFCGTWSISARRIIATDWINWCAHAILCMRQMESNWGHSAEQKFIYLMDTFCLDIAFECFSLHFQAEENPIIAHFAKSYFCLLNTIILVVVYKLCMMIGFDVTIDSWHDASSLHMCGRGEKRGSRWRKRADNSINVSIGMDAAERNVEKRWLSEAGEIIKMVDIITVVLTNPVL